MQVKISFADQVKKLIPVGEYTLSINVKAQGTDDKGNADQQFYCGTEDISVVFNRKRYRIEPEEIYSVYPPKGAFGDFHDHLPHIIFERTTLPWEFFTDKEPSLALLLFSETEEVRYTEGKVEELFGNPKEDEIYNPAIMGPSDLDFWDKDDVSAALDIPISLFQKVQVNKEERKLLTHIRKVSLDDKVTDPTVKSGEFASIICNRFLRFSFNQLILNC